METVNTRTSGNLSEVGQRLKKYDVEELFSEFFFFVNKDSVGNV